MPALRVETAFFRACRDRHPEWFNVILGEIRGIKTTSPKPKPLADTVRRGPFGRPRKTYALTPAERQRRYRARLKDRKT